MDKEGTAIWNSVIRTGLITFEQRLEGSERGSCTDQGQNILTTKTVHAKALKWEFWHIQEANVAGVERVRGEVTKIVFKVETDEWATTGTLSFPGHEIRDHDKVLSKGVT